MNNFVISYTHGKSLSVDLYRSLSVCVWKKKKNIYGAASLETALYIRDHTVKSGHDRIGNVQTLLINLPSGFINNVCTLLNGALFFLDSLLNHDVATQQQVCT